MADEFEDTIESNATGPKRAAGDAGSIEQHPLLEQIEADRYIAAKRATRASSFPLRLFKIKHPGAD